MLHIYSCKKAEKGPMAINHVISVGTWRETRLPCQRIVSQEGQSPLVYDDQGNLLRNAFSTGKPKKKRGNGSSNSSSPKKISVLTQIRRNLEEKYKARRKS